MSRNDAREHSDVDLLVTLPPGTSAHEYAGRERPRFDAFRLVQDAVIRKLQTVAESSQRLSTGIKLTEPAVAWRELSGLVVEQDLPAIARWQVADGSLPGHRTMAVRPLDAAATVHNKICSPAS